MNLYQPNHLLSPCSRLYSLKFSVQKWHVGWDEVKVLWTLLGNTITQSFTVKVDWVLLSPLITVMPFDWSYGANLYCRAVFSRILFPKYRVAQWGRVEKLVQGLDQTRMKHMFKLKVVQHTFTWLWADARLHHVLSPITENYWISPYSGKLQHLSTCHVVSLMTALKRGHQVRYVYTHENQGSWATWAAATQLWWLKVHRSPSLQGGLD